MLVFDAQLLTQVWKIKEPWVAGYMSIKYHQPPSLKWLWCLCPKVGESPFFSDEFQNLKTTVDGSEIQLNQLRLVVYPTIDKVLAPSRVVVWDFLHQQYHWMNCFCWSRMSQIYISRLVFLGVCFVFNVMLMELIPSPELIPSGMISQHKIKHPGWNYYHPYLVGGFKYFFLFIPEPWGNDPIWLWLIFFKGVETTNQLL